MLLLEVDLQDLPLLVVLLVLEGAVDGGNVDVHGVAVVVNEGLVLEPGDDVRLANHFREEQPELAVDVPLDVLDGEEELAVPVPDDFRDELLLELLALVVLDLLLEVAEVVLLQVCDEQRLADELLDAGVAVGDDFLRDELLGSGAERLVSGLDFLQRGLLRPVLGPRPVEVLDDLGVAVVDHGRTELDLAGVLDFLRHVHGPLPRDPRDNRTKCSSSRPS